MAGPMELGVLELRWDEEVAHEMDTTREKPSSSAGFGPLSSAGTGATNKALQLTYSSSAC